MQKKEVSLKQFAGRKRLGCGRRWERRKCCKFAAGPMRDHFSTTDALNSMFSRCDPSVLMKSSDLPERARSPERAT